MSLRDGAAKRWANYESLVTRTVFYMVQPSTVSKIITTVSPPLPPHTKNEYQYICTEQTAPDTIQAETRSAQFESK